MSIALSPVELARWLIAAILVAILVSPPLTVALELALYALMLGSADCRARLLRACREPLGIMALVFVSMAAVGLAYSIAPWEESLSIWAAWRRLLLLLFGLALFDELRWKLRFVWIVLALATLGALASYLAAFLNIGIRYYDPGIVFRNHAIQSMLFGTAAFAAALLLKHDGGLKSPQRIFLAVAAVVLCTNIVFVTTARSGYAALLVLAVLLAYTWPKTGAPLRRLGFTAAAVLVIGAALAASPIVQQRVARGLSELQSYQHGTQVSAMGERVVYMRNALELALERPIFGYGTGAFREAYARKVEGRPGREGIKTHDPHNAYLNLWVQHGIVGLLVFLALLASALRHPASQPYRLLGLAVLAAWCVTSLFNGHFSTFAEGRFIWLWLGACLAREK